MMAFLKRAGYHGQESEEEESGQASEDSDCTSASDHDNADVYHSLPGLFPSA